ncbi:CAP domain-containing protein [Myxococcaceae bacterium JPH2]|nr:CAP domain-containing protein [Myxococcaceae bacterium JPH2]
MIALALLSAVLTAAPAPDTPQAMEARASAHVVTEFERIGRRAPVPDSSLGAAARRLAREALTLYPSGAPDLFTLTDAVSDSGAADPSPRTLVIRAWAHAHAIETFEARQDFNEEHASHYGLGVAFDDARAVIVLLLVDRKVELQPFPRIIAADKAARTLCARWSVPMRTPEIYITRPDGEVERASLMPRASSGPTFCSRLTFDSPGTYTVEVVGNGDAGPEVAALFLTDLGPRKQRDDREPTREPTTVEDARRVLYERVNALRRAFRLSELTPDPALEQVAQRYSARMGHEGFFAHVAPDGSSLTSRLQGSRYVRAGENLGQASGPLAAHFGIEHSPGHRKNLLDPSFHFMGVGVTFQDLGGRKQAIVTEVFTTASPGAPEPVDPLADAYDTLMRHRSALKLPPMARSEVLERLARQHAQRALELDQPSAQPGEAPLHERVFAVLPDAGTAAVDFYVVGDPSAIPDSRSLADATNNRVGVGVVRGDSKRFGRGQYWVAVIYAAVP